MRYHLLEKGRGVLVLGFAAVLVAVLSCGELRASVLVPAGLSPGDTYQLVFVTSGTRDATSSDIADYNDFVQAQAAMSSSLTGTDMGVTYKALASTSLVDARDNAVVGSGSGFVGVFNMNGAKVADDFSDIWDSRLNAPISHDQFASLFGVNVWTGTNAGGDANSFRVLGSSVPVSGISVRIDGFWVSSAAQAAATLLPLYGLSSEIIVPAAAVVPEPTALLVWLGLAAIGWVGSSRRRKR